MSLCSSLNVIFLVIVEWFELISCILLMSTKALYTICQLSKNLYKVTPPLELKDLELEEAIDSDPLNPHL